MAAEEQKERTQRFLVESDSLRHFVAKRVEVDNDALSVGVSSAEMVAAYFEMCAQFDWTPFAKGRVERDLPELMLHIHQSAVGQHIPRDDRRVRGYPRVKLIVSKETENKPETD